VEIFGFTNKDYILVGAKSLTKNNWCELVGAIKEREQITRRDPIFFRTGSVVWIVHATHRPAMDCGMDVVLSIHC